jgi:hypothetical protein
VIQQLTGELVPQKDGAAAFTMFLIRSPMTATNRSKASPTRKPGFGGGTMIPYNDVVRFNYRYRKG